MTSADIRKTVIEALTRIAPEVDPTSIRPGTSFRDELDLDSMDFLNFVVGLHKKLAIEIPESDYPKLQTMRGAVEYLVGKLDHHPG